VVQQVGDNVADAAGDPDDDSDLACYFVGVVSKFALVFSGSK
jgi:hypothetical protein